jgi:hypothetical protein
MKTREITDSLGEIHIEIDNEDGTFICMPKAHYDELEAAKENGTIS